MSTKTITFTSLEQLEEIPKQLLEFTGNRKVFAFYGEMGIGKTTLINAICKYLHVSEPTSSPTYSIINEYVTTANVNLYHFDFYRLKAEAEAYDIGVEDYFYSGNYCFIEWPEKVASLLPSNCVEIRMTLDKNKRILILKL